MKKVFLVYLVLFLFFSLLTGCKETFVNENIENNHGRIISEEKISQETNNVREEHNQIVSGVWKSEEVNSKNKSLLIIDNVTEKGFNFQLFIVEYKNLDGVEDISQGGFDAIASFKGENTASFNSVWGDSIKETKGTISFINNKVHIEYENMIVYQEKYRVELVKDFIKVSESAYDKAGMTEIASIPFNDRELRLNQKYYYNVMPEDVLAVFGQPSSKEKGELFEDQFWEKWIYENIDLEFGGEYEGNRIYGLISIEIKEPSISFVRGTRVGDSLVEVIMKFPNENREIEKVYDKTIKPLYGVPEHFEDHGLIEYEDDKPTLIMYVREGEYLVYRIIDNKVVSIKAYGELV